MGLLQKLLDRIDKPADPSLLLGERNPGSEPMITSDTPDGEQAAAAAVRRARERRRWRWRH
jgi:hypothetical protein